MEDFNKICRKIRSCEICKEHLPLGPRPVFSISPKSKILVIGQAPGTKVHASGIPWDDPSGNLLRKWLNVSEEQFYNPDIFGIVPMGLCYPGKGKSGDLPPRPECAPEWHETIFKLMPELELTLLIGQYSQNYYLKNSQKLNLTKRVESFEDYLPQYFVLPHPSPRNRIWLKRNPWFEEAVIPSLQSSVKPFLS